MWRTEDDLVEKFTLEKFTRIWLAVIFGWFFVHPLELVQCPVSPVNLADPWNFCCAGNSSIHGELNIEEGLGFSPTTANCCWWWWRWQSLPITLLFCCIVQWLMWNVTFTGQTKALHCKNHPCVNSSYIIALWITQHPPDTDDLGLEKQQRESLSFYRSLSLFFPLPRSVCLFSLCFFCVPGPGLLTLAGSCVVLLPEGTVFGSTNSRNSWGGKSGINGCVVCVWVWKDSFFKIYFTFLSLTITSNDIQRHQPAHVLCQQKGWMERLLFPFFQIVTIILQIKPSSSNSFFSADFEVETFLKVLAHQWLQKKKRSLLHHTGPEHRVQTRRELMLKYSRKEYERKVNGS